MDPPTGPSRGNKTLIKGRDENPGIASLFPPSLPFFSSVPPGCVERFPLLSFILPSLLQRVTVLSQLV